MSLITGGGRIQRVVPWSTRLVVLFGGGVAAMGWFFFAFGMIFVWIFGVNGDFSSVLLFRGPLESAPALVTAALETNFSEGGRRRQSGTPRKGARIYAYDYQFTQGGQNFQGTSYRTGQGAREGDRVTAEFPAGRPDRSRLRGMRRAPFGPVIAFVFVFPAVGLAFVLPSLWRGWRNIGLLTSGEITAGRLTRKEPTNAQVNKRPVYKLTFEFADANGITRETVVKTSLTEKLSDESAEKLFYDPRNPAKAALLDNLPGGQAIAERGELRRCGSGAVLRALLGPLAASAVLLGGWLFSR